MPTHVVDTVCDIEGLRGLSEEWNCAAPPASSEPWQTFSWTHSAALAWAKNHHLRVTTVRTAGRLTAVAPLVLRQSVQPLAPWRIDFMAGELQWEPNRFVVVDRTALEPLVDAITSEKTYPIRLARIPDDDGTVKYLVDRFRRSGWITRVMNIPYPYLDLRHDPISKSLREDLRRARRKAERRGAVKSELVTVQSTQELLDRLHVALKIEASGWKGRNGTALLLDAVRMRFFEQYVPSALNDGTLRIRFLTIGEEVAAAQIGVEAAQASWLLKIAYDESYQECSPGNLLLEDSIRNGEIAGLERYNFLGIEESWTKRWTTQLQDCLDIAAYRLNPHGVKAMLSDALHLANNRRKARKVREAKEKRRKSD